jgi:hypothetical protein
MQHSAEPVAFSFHPASGSTCKLSEAALDIEAPLILYAYAQHGDAIYQHALAAGRISLSMSNNMFRSERCCQLKRSIAITAKSAGNKKNVRPAKC